MTYREYLAGIDDSHQMTTAREHIAEVCAMAAGASRVLELGSHAGLSTAAIALAAPLATVVSVDLCDTVPAAARVAYWGGLGITNIEQVAGDAGRYLAGSESRGERWDLVFHDARHGDAVVGEYLTCARVADRVAIHDWDRLTEDARCRVSRAFLRFAVSSPDDRGRQLFMGWTT